MRIAFSRSRLGLSVLPLLFACRPTQATPAPAAVAVDAAVTAAALDPTDPAALSGAPEDFAQIDPTLTFTADGAVIVAWTSLRPHAASVIRARFSRDNGATWEGTQTLNAPDGRSASEASLTADAAGDVYVAWVGRHDLPDGGVDDAHVYVARAEAKGTTFGAPVEVSAEMHHAAKMHKPWMAVTGAGTVMVTWSYTHPNGDGIGISHTKDGVAWTPGIVIERIDLGAKLPYLCAASHSDRAWIAYLDLEAGVRLRGSDDGGDSWTPARVATVSLPEDKKWIAAEETPLCVGDGDNVTVAFARKRPSDAGVALAASSLVVARSIDGGRTFDIRYAHDAGAAFLLDPQIAREPDGTTDIAFYASGATPESASLRWLHADEHALSAAHVARDHLRFEPSPTAAAWPGEHFGWAWHDGSLFAAASDNTEGKPHVAFARVPVVESAAARSGAAPAASHERATAP